MTGEIEKLFARQARAWPQLAAGLEGLARAQTRAVRIDWFEILVRHLPHRIASTTAAVDRKSVASRRCFLCAANLPPEEEGIRFGDGFTIYCNPFPILERHLTIAHSEHRKQELAGHLSTMLDLAEALSGYFVIYNGPECGASAPDHLHFQAGLRNLFPIGKDTAQVRGVTVPNYARNVLLFRGENRSALIDRMDCAIGLLAETSGRREPLINIAIFHDRGAWTAFIFPRGKHRPEIFHTGQLMVSPAAIDLCGVLVVPRAKDFETITGDAIASVFREVTLPDDQLREVVARLEHER